MSILKTAFAAVAAAVLGSTSALAVGITPSGGGGNNFYSLSPDGNVMGLFTLVDVSVGETLTLSDFQGLITQPSAPAVINVFAGSPGTLPPEGAGNNRNGRVSVAGFIEPFGANANDGLTVEVLSRDSGSVFDAVFLEFAGTAASGGSSMPANFKVTVSNGTFEFDSTKSNFVELGTPTPVPVPAALPLLAAGLGVFGLIARRKARAAV